jgi:pyridoxine/pyridoxamine 5'-phosphate oxidase
VTPETVAAGAKTLTFKFRSSAKLGKEVKYRGTLAPKNVGGQVTYYFTSPKNAAKIKAIAGSQSVNAKGKAVLKTAVPVQLKAKRNYWVVAEYTSPTGETIRAVRKFKANAP